MGPPQSNSPASATDIAKGIEMVNRKHVKKYGCVADLIFLFVIGLGAAVGYFSSGALFLLLMFVAGPLLFAGAVFGIMMIVKGSVGHGIAYIVAAVVVIPLLTFVAFNVTVGIKGVTAAVEQKRLKESTGLSAGDPAQPEGSTGYASKPEKPAESAPPDAPEPELREWQSTEGKSLNGTLVGASQVDKVPTLEIESPEGKVLKIPAWRLAADEIAYAQQFTELPLPPLSGLEEWTAADGRKMSARLISAGTSGQCVFVREDGSVFHVALDKLSAESQSEISALKID